MTDYQVLARKWRPSRFESFVGQDQVLQALRYALDNNSVHHAYLFTGTRGVGKTSLGRLMAKCLNCEEGISSNPCDKCSSCLEIDKGCFVDLIEIDAASKTKVEDTRELIDNIQYSPAKGRVKIYLIDEVHMLSNHSFNALLKTLEEPPSHVKFLLATTEFRKLPETILSRVMQFHLREIGTKDISSHLSKILDKENIYFDPKAVDLIASHAKGSMRDALSFLDMIIATGAGKVLLDLTENTLGCVPYELIIDLIEIILNKDSKNLLPFLHNKIKSDFNFLLFLDSAANFIYELALIQHVLINNINNINNINDEFINNFISDVSYSDQLKSRIKQIASDVSADTLHFLYQSLLRGKEEISLAPDPRVGFEMICLRLVSFFNNDDLSRLKVSKSNYESSDSNKNSSSIPVSKATNFDTISKDNKNIKNKVDTPQSETSRVIADFPEDIELEPAIWVEFAKNISVSGLAKQLLLNITLVNTNNGVLSFEIDKRFKSLLNDQIKHRLLKSIRELKPNVKGIEINSREDKIESEKSLSSQIKVEKINKTDEDIKKIINNEDFNYITANFSVQLQESSVVRAEDT